MKIYLDDNRPTPPGWVAATTAEEAKLHFLCGKVDDISLDYDLDLPFCGTCNFLCGHREDKCRHSCDCHNQETGESLLQWMIRTNHWSRNKPTVHSANKQGASRMKALIEKHFV